MKLSAFLLLLVALVGLSSSVNADNVLVTEDPDSGNVLVTEDPDASNVLVTEEPGSDNVLVTDEPGSDNVLVSKEPTIESPPPACALIKCSDQGDGVCGSDGVTYTNACQLTAAQCGHPGLHQVGGSPCPAPSETPIPAPHGCPDVCPRVFLPVCDASGTIYGNPCEFMQARCKDNSLEFAECPGNKCALPHCAPIEKPVCASNGKTYMNRCLFSYFACKDPSLTVEHDGDCESNSGDEVPTGCAAVLCRPFSECRVDEKTGRGYCADICDPKVCSEDKICVLKTVQCVTTPCPPIAECVKKTSS